MLNEIGSTFFDYSLSKDERNEHLWWEDKKYNLTFFKSGRNAIKALLQTLKCPKKALLPIYTCETVVQPFIDEGWEIEFYLLNKNLSMNTASVEKLYKAFNPSVFFCHKYFGFNTIGDDKKMIRYFRDKGTIIVEDITQCIFSNHYIEFADYYVSSLRKFLAIPDGGIVFSKNRLFFSNINETDRKLSELAIEAFDLKKEYFAFPSVEKKEVFREKYQELNRLIADNSLIRNITPESKKIFSTCDIDEIKNKRVSNFLFLFQMIKKFDFLYPIINIESTVDIPLYLPVYVKNSRKKMQDFLACHNIYCPVIWPKPSQINTNDETTNYMYEHMLCFPIDQRYDIKDMERILSVLNLYTE